MSRHKMNKKALEQAQITAHGRLHSFDEESSDDDSFDYGDENFS